MEILDMYGQPIKFSYKNSPVFSTCCGLCVSLIVYILIICYSVLLILDIIKMDNPTILNTPVSFYDPPYYRFISDFKRVFNSSAEEPLDSIDDNSTGVMQLSFGYADRVQWQPLDPTEVVLLIENVFRDHSEILYIDTCKRYPYVDNRTMKMYDIGWIYCLYSSFETEGNSLCTDYSYLRVSLKTCKNNTYVYKKRKDLVSYKKLYQVFKASEEQNQPNPFRLNWSNYQEKEIELNEDYSDYDIYDQLFVEPASLSHDTDPNYVICKSKNEIASVLAERTLYLGYHATLVNKTSVDRPVVRYFELKNFELGMSLMQTAQIFVQKDRMCTFNSVVPKSLSKQNNTIYYFRSNENLFNGFPGDYDGENIIKILIQSSDNINNYERTYRNFFDILGLIGGLSKIFLIVGGVFVYKFAYRKMKESLINEFYNIIDPEDENLKKAEKSFSQFLIDLNEKKDPTDQMSEKEKILAAKFDQERVQKFLEFERKLNSQKNDNINSEDEKLRTAKERLSYNLAKVIYHVYKSKIYSGFSFSYPEIVWNIICCRCCISERLRRKNLTFLKAIAQLQADTDFLSIIKCVQGFENIKSVYFKKETQLNLFRALANRPFMADETEKLKMEDEDTTKIEKNKQVDKDLLILKRENIPSIKMGQSKGIVEYENNLNTLCNNLWSFLDKKQIENLDEKLIHNLIGLDRSNGNSVKEIMEDIKTIIAAGQPNLNQKNTEQDEDVQIYKENLEFLNNKYSKK